MQGAVLLHLKVARYEVKMASRTKKRTSRGPPRVPGTIALVGSGKRWERLRIKEHGHCQLGSMCLVPGPSTSQMLPVVTFASILCGGFIPVF